MSEMDNQITSLAIVYSNVYSGADQRKRQSFALLVFVGEFTRDGWIPRTKGQSCGKSPFDDVIIGLVPGAMMMAHHGSWRHTVVSSCSTSPKAYTLSLWIGTDEFPWDILLTRINFYPSMDK